MDREDSLMFGADIGGETSAEERIKSLLGDPSDRGLAAARRRVVRRPFGSGGYQAQAIIFSERERDGSPSLSTEPLSAELLQLAASRKGHMPLRASRDSTGSVLQSLTAATEPGRARAMAGGATPAQQLRAVFVQELLLSTLALPASSLDPGPLDGDYDGVAL